MEVRIRYAEAKIERRAILPSGEVVQVGWVWALGANRKYYKLKHKGTTELVTSNLKALADKIRKEGIIRLEYWEYWQSMTPEEIKADLDAACDNHNEMMGM